MKPTRVIDYDPTIANDGAVAYQPKIDGIRATCTREGWRSRTGRPLRIEAPDLPHGIMLDGEITIGDLSPAAIAARISSGSVDGMMFHVFDLFDPANPTMVLSDRLIEAAPMARKNGFSVLETIYATKDAIAETHARNVRAGFEGTIIRDAAAPYGAAGSVRRLKDFQDCEFRIVAANGKSISCCTADGAVFRVPTSRATAGARPGRRMKIRYCGCTPNGLPRDAVALGVRPWWDILGVTCKRR